MKKQFTKRMQKAFTLVEVMAVIVIIGLLAAVAAQNFLGQTDKAKVKTTRASMATLQQAVVMFKMSTGRYPSEEAGLEELIVEPTDVEEWTPGGYLTSTEVPRDAWKHDFIYQLSPESGKPFVIISYGADGKEGGEGFDADLYSTDAE